MSRQPSADQRQLQYMISENIRKIDSQAGLNDARQQLKMYHEFRDLEYIQYHQLSKELEHQRQRIFMGHFNSSV